MLDIRMRGPGGEGIVCAASGLVGDAVDEESEDARGCIVRSGPPS